MASTKTTTTTTTSGRTVKRNGFHSSSMPPSSNGSSSVSIAPATFYSNNTNVNNTNVNNTNVNNNPTMTKVKKRKSSSSSSTPIAKTFAYLLVGAVLILGSVQCLLNAVLFQMLEASSGNHPQDIDPHTGLPVVPLQQQIQQLQYQIHQFHHQLPHSIYIEDGNFYPFSIRDSRRLVPTQLPMGFHIWDYLDITTQNQQRTKKASLFHNAMYQAPAACQSYDLLCYKQKIIQVFELVLEQNPYTQYFFYMEADNELCVPLSEIRRYAYQYQRYFITTGIGFSGWIMKRDFMTDFIQELKDFQPPPRNPRDILSQQGPMPSEGPDPIASVMLIEKQAWTVTRKYLVSHSIQPSLGIDALTVRMPTSGSDTAQQQQSAIPPQPKPQVLGVGAGASAGAGARTNTTSLGPIFPPKPGAGAAGPAAKITKGLDKHLPRCLEPRRSKWRISKKDHRDRFGWDYFDYDECDGEVFPCFEGQLEELLEKDMAQFNYTELDLERKKLIAKQQERQRKKLLLEQGIKPQQHPAPGGNKELSSKLSSALAAIHGGSHHTGRVTTADFAALRQQKIALATEAMRKASSVGGESSSSTLSQPNSGAAAAAAASASANILKDNPVLAARLKEMTEKARKMRLEEAEQQQPQQPGPYHGGETYDEVHHTIQFFPGGGNPGLRGGAGTL